MGLLAGALGWVVTDVSCSQPDASGATAGCPGWAAFWAGLSFIGVTVSMALVLVLVYRSLGEWRERSSQE